MVKGNWKPLVCSITKPLNIHFLKKRISAKYISQKLRSQFYLYMFCSKMKPELQTWICTLSHHICSHAVRVHTKITIWQLRVYMWSISRAWEKNLVVDKFRLSRDWWVLLVREMTLNPPGHLKENLHCPMPPKGERWIGQWKYKSFDVAQLVGKMPPKTAVDFSLSYKQ